MNNGWVRGGQWGVRLETSKYKEGKTPPLPGGGLGTGPRGRKKNVGLCERKEGVFPDYYANSRKRGPPVAGRATHRSVGLPRKIKAFSTKREKKEGAAVQQRLRKRVPSPLAKMGRKAISRRPARGKKREIAMVLVRKKKSRVTSQGGGVASAAQHSKKDDDCHLTPEGGTEKGFLLFATVGKKKKGDVLDRRKGKYFPPEKKTPPYKKKEKLILAIMRGGGTRSLLTGTDGRGKDLKIVWCGTRSRWGVNGNK